MTEVTTQQAGMSSLNDPEYFQKNLNRAVIEGCEDYRLVLFFIKKGTKMHLHDHPNMSVYFRTLFGELAYRGFDKVPEKFRYNQFSSDEYFQILGEKTTIDAKVVNETVIKGSQFMLVRPSTNNMHEFKALEDTCFFDICLPNYSTDSLRRITYFKEIEDKALLEKGMTKLEYFASPPIFPEGFEINEVNYKGEY